MCSSALQPHPPLRGPYFMELLPWFPISQGLATVIPSGWGSSLLWICGAQRRDRGSVRGEESLRETVQWRRTVGETGLYGAREGWKKFCNWDKSLMREEAQSECWEQTGKSGLNDPKAGRGRPHSLHPLIPPEQGRMKVNFIQISGVESWGKMSPQMETQNQTRNTPKRLWLLGLLLFQICLAPWKIP